MTSAELDTLARQYGSLALDYGELDFVNQDASAIQDILEAFPRVLALARVGLAQQWQPIETAPKDGRIVLTWTAACLDGLPRTLAFQDYGRQGEGWYGASGRKWNQPTHWMPLPAPPAPPEAEQ